METIKIGLKHPFLASASIKNGIIKCKYYENGKAKISKEGVEWLCRNCFKHKYLELLEEYRN